jgi:hypothetical protein
MTTEWLFEKLWEQPKDKFNWHYYLKIAKRKEKEQLIGLLEWMNKVTAESPMRLETDNEDIVEQYLETYERKPNL